MVKVSKIALSFLSEMDGKTYEQGIVHMSAAIASKFREDKLGTTEMKSQFPTQMYTTGVNKGGLLIPNEDWLSDVKKMDTMFMEHHPTDFLNKGVGLTENFTKTLQNVFPHRKVELLECFCRARTRARIRHINRKIMAPKRGTLRGRRKLVEWVF